MEVERVLGELKDVQIIAVGTSIRELPVLEKLYGSGRWRKLKAVATVETVRGDIGLAEVHWYEAHGIGRRKMKVKRWISPP